MVAADSFSDPCTRPWIPISQYLQLGKLTAVARLQPKGADSIKAIGRARRGGVEVDGHDKLMNFGAFEAHAGSSLRRATGNMYAMNGRNVQVGAGHTGTPRPLIGVCGAVVGVARPAACQMTARSWMPACTFSRTMG